MIKNKFTALTTIIVFFSIIIHAAGYYYVPFDRIYTRNYIIIILREYILLHALFHPRHLNYELRLRTLCRSWIARVLTNYTNCNVRWSRRQHIWHQWHHPQVYLFDPKKCRSIYEQNLLYVYSVRIMYTVYEIFYYIREVNAVIL